MTAVTPPASLRLGTASLRQRVVRCTVGLVVCGIGIAMIVDGDVGLAPWDVLHKGISERTGVAVGTVIIIVGFCLLALWIPLQVRPGLGTILNAALIGATVNIALDVLPEPGIVALGVAEMLAGVVVFALGTALYINAGLGPGPRDGLMTGLAARGLSVRVARTVIELVVLVAGWLLGGSIGIGTAVCALAIGPLVQLFLRQLGDPLARAHAAPVS